MSTEETETNCTRCGITVPPYPPRSKAIRHRIRITRTVHTVVHRLVYSRVHFEPWTENPADQIRSYYSDLDLCDPCADKVFLFAQGKEGYFVPDTTKSLRETLCVAQAYVGNSDLNESLRRRHLDVLGRLIGECDRMRPLGPDGKHGDLHTPLCGCQR